MPNFRIACHIYTWEDLSNNVVEPIFRQIAEAGYEGVEGLDIRNAEDLVETAAAARAWGLQVVNAKARTPSQCIRYNAALGNRVCEIWEGFIQDYGGEDLAHDDRFPLIGEFFAPIIAEAARFRIQLTHHIHMGQLVVTNGHVDTMVRTIPGMGIMLDTGHLLAAGGDPMRVIRDHGERINHVHLKDFHQAPSWDPGKPDWTESHFAPIGQGNVGFDAGAVLKGLEEIGSDDWVSVELDPQKPLRAKGIRPAEFMRQSREYLRSIGY